VLWFRVELSISKDNIDSCIREVRYLLVFLIITYQKVAPKRVRNRCIFKHSCSSYVLDGAREAGTVEAVRRLGYRWKSCRPGYALIKVNLGEKGEITRVALTTNEVVEPTLLRDTVLNRLGFR
jgi:uncharacterized protein